MNYIVFGLLALAAIYMLLGMFKSGGRDKNKSAPGRLSLERRPEPPPAPEDRPENGARVEVRTAGPGYHPLGRGDLEAEVLWHLEHVLRGLQNPAGAVVQVDFSLEPREVALALASNPMYAARILKTVNSASFGLRQRIDSLQRAITFLGYNQAKNIIYQNMARDNLGALKETPRGFDQKRFWQHSHAVSVCADFILRELGAERGRAGTITTAALLHDIGWAVFGSFDREAAERLFARLGNADEETEPLEAEEAAFGFNHLVAGGMLAEHWQIPPVVCTLISQHHCGTYGLPDMVEREVAFGACVIAKAESLAAQIGYSHPLAEPHELRVDLKAVLGAQGAGLSAGTKLKQELERTMKLIEEFSRSV